MKRIYYYNNLEDDVIKSNNQEYKLNSNYKWIKKNIFYKFFSYVIYFFVLIFAFIYLKLVLHIKVKNRRILKNEKGYFLYANHTQMLGDVFVPFLICFPKRPYIICSTANLGIPFIGKLLPIAGALPIPDNIHDMIKFKEAINYHINHNNPVIIYPEGHLWPYATFIRNFPNTSFHYPVENNKKIYVMTTTYTKSKYFKKPKRIIYIDGPFENNNDFNKKQNMNELHKHTYETMVERSKLSNYEYVVYKKKN